MSIHFRKKLCLIFISGYRGIDQRFRRSLENVVRRISEGPAASVAQLKGGCEPEYTRWRGRDWGRDRKRWRGLRGFRQLTSVVANVNSGWGRVKTHNVKPWYIPRGLDTSDLKIHSQIDRT